MDEIESYETIELTFKCDDCEEVWTEFQEFVCESECDQCGKEHIKAFKVREFL